MAKAEAVCLGFEGFGMEAVGLRAGRNACTLNKFEYSVPFYAGLLKEYAELQTQCCFSQMWYSKRARWHTHLPFKSLVTACAMGRETPG